MVPALYHAFHPTIKGKSPNAKVFIQPSDVMGTDGCVGALAPNVVMVDIDNAEDLAAFERVLGYTRVRVPTMITPHGKHFYFLANPEVVDCNYTRGLLACGVMADIKVGAKNGFDCLKQEGDLQWREWVNEDAQLIPYPAFCKPVLKGNRAQEQGSFAGLRTGSRNDNLFKFITALKNGGFDYKSTLALCRMINRVVLPEPLDEQEVETICRPESYKSAYTNHKRKTKAYFNGTHSNASTAPAPDQIEEEVLEQLTPRAKAELVLGLDTLRYVDNNLYIKQGDIWRMSMDKNIDEHREIYKVFPNVLSARLREIRLVLDTLIPAVDMAEEQHRAKDLIPFRNGVYNLNDGTFKGYDEYEGYYFFRQIPHDYRGVPEALPLVLEDFLASCTSGDPQIRTMLYEMAGACFHDDVRLRGCFILIGEKSKGKSTFLNFLRAANGRENSASVKIHEFLEPFMTGNLLSKTANFGDDIAAGFIKETSVLKSIITGDNVTVNIKYHKPVTTRLTATQVFTANALPRFTDPSGALMSRIKLIPFNAQFDKPNVSILDQLDTEDVYSAFSAMAIEAYRAALERGSYTEAAIAKRELDEYKDYNADSVTAFVRDEYDNNAALLNTRSVSEVYELYVRYCDDEQCARIGKNIFVNRVLLVLPELTRKTVRSNGRRAVYFSLKTTGLVEGAANAQTSNSQKSSSS